MSYKIVTDTTGQVDVDPRRVKILSTNTLAEITTAGYLSSNAGNPDPIKTTDVIDVIYGLSSLQSPDGGTYEVFRPSFGANGVITLVAWANPGDVLLPVVDKHLAAFNGTTGQIFDNGYVPSNTAKTKVVMLSSAGVVNQIPYFTDTSGTIDGTAGASIFNAGNISAGKSATAGTLSSFPSASAKGSLKVAAVANTNDTVTTISNAAMGQASVVSIPDPAAATANFLLDAGTANTLTDFQEFVSLEQIFIQTVGTWTPTRVGVGDYSLVKTATAETAITAFDVTPQLRAAANKGFKLASFDVIYAIGTLAVVAHSATLSSVVCVDNVGLTATNVPLTGALATASRANLYVTNLAVTTPAFLNTAVAKYAVEVTVNAAATSIYAIYGLNLHFSQTIA